MTLAILLAFAAVAFIGIATPGPTVLLALTNGSRYGLRRALQLPLPVRIGRFFFHVRCAREHEISRPGKRAHQDALHDQQREDATLAGIQQPLDRTERALWARIEDIQCGNLTRIDSGPES